MQDLEISLLRSFVTVARAGTIRDAADRIGRTQSAVSLQIKRLEARVGEPLFHRSGSGVILTVAGERFISGAELILATHDEVAVGFGSARLQGTVALGCPEDFMTAFFPDMLSRYGRQYPDVEIEIVCAPTVELLPLLRRRQIDLAVVSRQTADHSDPVIRREPLVWIASAQGAGLASEPVVPLALSGPDTIDHREARRALHDSCTPHRVAHSSNGLAGLLAIVRSGLAISVVTRAAVPEDVVILEEVLPPLPEIGIGISYASTRPSPTVSSLGAFIETQLA